MQKKAKYPVFANIWDILPMVCDKRSILRMFLNLRFIRKALCRLVSLTNLS